MSALPKTKHYIIPEEYLIFERECIDQKHEYFDGEIFAMSSASRRHNIISFTISGLLFNTLNRRNCEAYIGEMRVKIPETGLYTYPDIVVVCEEPELEDQVFDTLLNPSVIIEILSNSTENYDRGKKFEHYRTIKSLQEYLLISQGKMFVEHYQRQYDHRWIFETFSQPEEKIILPSIKVEFSLKDIYEKINF